MNLAYFRILLFMFFAGGIQGAFLRYGTSNGDRRFPYSGYNKYYCVSVSSSFPLFTKTGHRRLCMSTNGYIGVDTTSSSIPYYNVLIPYYVSYLRSNGYNILYRLTSTSSDLTTISNDVRLILGNEPGTPANFTAQYAFVVTFNNVPYLSTYNSRRYTFQAIIATDWKHTFAIFNYGRLDTEATFVGFSDAQTLTGKLLQQPYRNLVRTSNVGITGKHVFMLSYEKPQAFYPYGTNARDGYRTIRTSSHYSYYMRTLSNGWSFFSKRNGNFQLYVSTEGVIHVGSSHIHPPYSSKTYIAPYYFSRFSRSSIYGRVFYRETTNATLLNEISLDIQRKMSNGFNATRAFLVTFMLFRYKFQAVLATNGMETYAVLNYYSLERDALHVGMNEVGCGMQTFVSAQNSSTTLLAGNSSGTPGRHVFSLTKKGCFVYVDGVKSIRSSYYSRYIYNQYSTYFYMTQKVLKSNEFGSLNFVLTELVTSQNHTALSLLLVGQVSKYYGSYRTYNVILGRSSSNIYSYRYVHINSLFLFGSPQNSQNFQYGTVRVTIQDHDVTCQNIIFSTEMASLPAVKVTLAITRNSYNEYANVWLRNVSRTGFTVCAKEMLAFSGMKRITVNYIAATMSSNIIHEVHHFTLTPATRCRKMEYKKIYVASPNVFASPEDDGSGTNVIFSWIKTISHKEFEICATSANKQEIKMHVLVHGKLSRCTKTTCPDHLECYESPNTPMKCDCIKTCANADDSTEFCGSDYQSYQSMCQLNRDHCLKYGNNTKSNVTILHNGKCQHKPLQAGRAELEAVQEMPGVFCKYINIDVTKFLATVSYQSLRVLLTPSWDQETFTVPNDASASWTEDVTVNGFKACVLVAGHHVASYFVTKPVIHWTVFLDVFFKNGTNAQSGAVTMSTWYTGTQCKIMFFSRQSHHVYLTVQHAKPKSYQNALTVWTEILNSYTYRACARELQNFDGKHEGVILHWLAVPKTNVPVPIYIPEQIDVTFPRKYVSNAQRNTAECKTVPYNRHYPSLPKPTVLIGGSFRNYYSSTSKHDIAVWIEETSTSNLTVCIKSVLTATLPATTISALIIPTLCREGESYFEGSCYSLTSQPACSNKAAAVMQCQSSGYDHLPRINDENESSFLDEVIDEVVWLDLQKNNGNWQWADGSSLSFENWLQDQPANIATDNCAVIENTGNTTGWKSEDCSSCHNVVCERDANLVERSCENHQCENNGTCTVDNSLLLRCSCIEGYGGNHCEIDLRDVEGCGNYTLHNENWRSISNTNIQSNATSCDATNLRYGWHRFVTQNVDGRLASSCTTSGCGTRSPGWVIGPYPEESLGLTNNTIHFHTYYCADDHGQASIKNCGSFYVYKFIQLPFWSCDHGLCIP